MHLPMTRASNCLRKLFEYNRDECYLHGLEKNSQTELDIRHSPVNKLLYEEVVDAARVVLDFVREGGHLLRTAAVDGREIFLGVGVAVILQLQFRVRRDDGQLLEVLQVHGVGGGGGGWGSPNMLVRPGVLPYLRFSFSQVRPVSGVGQLAAKLNNSRRRYIGRVRGGCSLAACRSRLTDEFLSLATQVPSLLLVEMPPPFGRSHQHPWQKNTPPFSPPVSVHAKSNFRAH